MFRKKVFIALLACGLVLSLLFGCANNAASLQKQKDTETTLPAATNIETEKVDEGKVLQNFENLLKEDGKPGTAFRYLDANLSLVSPAVASQLVLGMMDMQKSWLPALEERYYNGQSIQKMLLDLYENGIEIGSTDNLEDPLLKELLQDTIAGGYRVETAEGMFFPIIDYHRYDLYSAFLSEDLRRYLSLLAEESEHTAVKDAAIVIEWEDIAQRALQFEEFVQTYPGFARLPEARTYHSRYINLAILGANNTPAFGHDDKTLAPELRKAYVEIAAMDSQNRFVKAVREYLSLLDKNKDQLNPVIDSFRKDVIKELTGEQVP
jgi:hypothetical protein